jgi:oligoendopeptidase F
MEFDQVQGGQNSPKWPQIVEYKGKLQDPRAAARFFESYLSLQRKLEKLHTYAHLRLDEDLGNDSFKGDFGSISSLIHEFSLETSWVEPEFLSLNQGEIDGRFHLSSLSISFGKNRSDASSYAPV